MLSSPNINAVINHFDKSTSHLPRASEVQLFRALMKGMTHLGLGVDCYETHGLRHQVELKSVPNWWQYTSHAKLNKKPRCEISDLMIVWYEPKQKTIRLSFLQAKRSYSDPRLQNNNRKFKGNWLQRDLLAAKPIIKSVSRNFNPPSDLFSGSSFTTLGTIGVFYKTSPGYDLFYASADKVSQIRTVRARKSFQNTTLTTNVDLNWFCPHGSQFHCELNSAPNLKEYLVHLFSGHIGEFYKIDSKNPVIRWIGAILTNLRNGSRDSFNDSSERLLNLIESDFEVERESEPPSNVLVVNGGRFDIDKSMAFRY